MIYKLSRKIAKIMLDNNVIKLNDYEIYLYGLQSLISTFLDITAIIIIAAFWGQILNTIVFLIFFCILRLNAGGYHASTYFKCFLFITLMNFISIGLVENLNYVNSVYFTVPLLIFSLFLILKYAPVDTPNKPLSKIERKVYKKRSIIIFVIQSIIILSAYFINENSNHYCNIAAMAVWFETILLLPINKILKLNTKEERII